MPSALIVDDSRDARDALAGWLGQCGFSSVQTARTLAEARAVLETRFFDLVLLDLQLPDGSGLDLFQRPDELADSEVVVITGHGTIDSAVDAMKGGAVDYLTKPVDMRRLDGIVARVRRTHALRSEIDALRAELRRIGHFGPMVGTSSVMQQVYDLIARVAPTSSSVLITGETGTGKELVAETLHRLSRRAKKPFLPVNCAAVAPTLIESELFGHERGSFTGAERQHKGIFERADGGTLLLDEITEMPVELQVRLLRVLETKTFSRIGGAESIAVDVRLVAATNRDPGTAVQEGKLRQDLLYRLNVFPIEVPPLRDRKEDIELLAGHFVKKLNKEANAAKRLTPAAIERLRLHGWPGNVRELRNVVERAFIIAAATIDADSIPLDGAPAPAPAASSAALRLDVGTSIADAERQLILATLDRFAGDKKRTAAVLGISLKTLYTRLASYAGKG
jgi:DNA-binding NtrC family response regulator